MTHDEKKALRDLRDEMDDAEDKRIVRKAVDYITKLENRLHEVRVLTRSIQRVAEQE